MLRADAGVCPGESALSGDLEQDCLLFFLLDYDDVDFKITSQNVSKTSAPLDNTTLGLAKRDADWHMPMLVHVGSSACPSGYRKRGAEAKAKRKKADNRRRTEAKSAAKRAKLG